MIRAQTKAVYEGTEIPQSIKLKIWKIL